MNPNTPSVGRPRHPGTDKTVLVAARRLLGEVGYRQTTITAIARRAKVSAPAIYRRWPTREALLEAAIHGTGGHPLPESTSHLRADLETWARIFLARAASPAARSGVPGLLADMTTESDRARLLALQNPVQDAFAARLDQAIEEGEIPAPVHSSLLFELLSGATSIRGLMQGNTEADAFVAELAGALFVLAAHGAAIVAETKGVRR